jgi:hypothetical protein
MIKRKMIRRAKKEIRLLKKLKREISFLKIALKESQL